MSTLFCFSACRRIRLPRSPLIVKRLIKAKKSESFKLYFKKVSNLILQFSFGRLLGFDHWNVDLNKAPWMDNNALRSIFCRASELSYRKKDRSFAQELMKKNHSEDNARDWAIWYDEFLAPGERFDKQIEDAIASCGIFALAVTPIILEKGNYIETDEFSYAIGANKPIFPVEMVPTEEERLIDNEKFKDYFEHYQQIPYNRFPVLNSLYELMAWLMFSHLCFFTFTLCALVQKVIVDKRFNMVYNLYE